MTKLVNENEIDKNNETQHIESIEEEKKSKKRKRDKKEKKSKKQKREKREKQLGSLTSSIFSPENDFSSMKLRSDHQNRPIWVCPNNRIFLESFSPIYQQAYDFLVAISEPVSRPELIHEYVLTSYSLFAAVSIGLETEQIINVLDKLSKVEISESVADFIRRCTSTYGKVKLVLKSNRFFIESAHRDVLEALLRDPVIASSKIDPNPETDVIDEETGLLVHVYDEEFEDAVVKLKKAKKQKEKDQQTQQTTTIIEDDDVQEVEDFVAQAQKKSSGNRVLAFEIDTNKVEHVKKRCIELDLPTLEEYDFRNDTNNPNLPIDLKPTTSIRSYQEKSLSKMFGNGRARSGIIVLPCGAGKTLVGITAACTVKKSTLVLCTNAVSVEQWYEQFKLWSNVPENRLIRFTSERKEKIPEDGGACALFTTYNMLTYSGQRGFEGKEIMQEIQNREWGLMLLDEVHVVPADTFRRVISVAKAHAKLGLTATLVREDHKEEDLYFLIGPKLYEANWLDLQKAGYLATVQCVEVWCPMTPEFYREYLNASASKKKLLYVMNPNKFRACEFLIRYHEQRGDKIIVFSDNVYALEKYAKAMGKPFIHGPTHQRERMEILRRFKNRTDWNCIFISKVGDTSIDLPDTSVIIQISSHFGSRRQEAQRLGRILRPKSVEKRGINAYFYSLVSQDTYEMFYSTKRQQFLINQGYAFKVLPNITEIIKQNEHMISVIKTKRDELNLLAEVKAADDSKAITERAPDDDFAPVSTSRRSRSSLKILSGAGDSMYMEIPGGRRSRKKSEGVGTKSYTSRHPLFRKRYGK